MSNSARFWWRMEGCRTIALIGFVGARPAVTTARGESGCLTKLSLLFAQLFFFFFYRGDWFVLFFVLPSPGATTGLF